MDVRSYLPHGMVRTANEITKVFHSDGCEYAEIALLSWIRYCHFEFGNVYPSKEQHSSNQFHFVYRVKSQEYALISAVQFGVLVLHDD